MRPKWQSFLWDRLLADGVQPHTFGRIRLLRQHECKSKPYTQGRARILLCSMRMANTHEGEHSLLPDNDPILCVDRSSAGEQPAGSIVARTIQKLIRDWALRRSAELQLRGTESGPALSTCRTAMRDSIQLSGRRRFPDSWDSGSDFTPAQAALRV